MSNNQVSIKQANRIMATQFKKLGSKAKILILGAPGTAKSASVYQFTESIGYTMIDLRLANKSPEDLSGYPHIVNGVMHYAIPHWFPTEKKTVLFVDEIAQAPMAVQNVALQLILDRRIGSHILPDDCMIIAASNRPEDRAGATALTTALRSRFTAPLTIHPEKDEWLEWAKANELNPLVIAWAQSQLEEVLTFDPRQKGGFISPRTLEYASDNMSAYDNDPANPDLRAILFGLLGDEGAANLIAFCETIKALPTMAEILSDPTGASTSTEMIEPIAKMLAAQTKYANVPKVLRYIRRYPAEQQAVLVRAIEKIGHPDIAAIMGELAL